MLERITKKIFVDPSATGTTGICIAGSEITFLKFGKPD
jgi:hypothetical protein